jgi:hypothetical protein
MRERPILFKNGMVQAILAGRKTQTRRIVGERERGGYLHSEIVRATTASFYAKDCVEVAWRCPYGEPGDRLWVRERFAVLDEKATVKKVAYAADWPADHPVQKWKAGLFMPRWISRLTLELTAVRVERIQEISEEDAIAEGVEPMPHARFAKAVAGGYGRAYRALWERINGPGSWEANPWVWVLECKRV